MNITLKDTPTNRPNQSKDSLKPTFFQMKSYPHDGILEQLAFMLIRPPRFIYNPDILKPSRRIVQKYAIETHSIPFELTVYKPANLRYIIMYLHGNGSSRFEGTLFVNSLPEGVGLACFDFNGCGNRTGQFITLGQQESKQVDTAVIFLKKFYGVKIVGWGRSMGAVSLLLSKECDIMVSDSAYANLSQLCKQSSSKFLPKACCCIFHCFYPCVFSCIKSKVYEKSELVIDNMNIAERLKLQPASDIYTQKHICFIHGQQDTMIPTHHAQMLHNSFQGKKKLILFQGTHNSSRPSYVILKCFQFIEDGLQSLSQRLPENVRLSKMVELQQVNRPVKLQPIQIIPSRNSIVDSSLLASNRPSEIKVFEKSFDKDQSEYVNLQQGNNTHLKQEQDKDFNQANVKQEDIPKFCEVIGKDDYQQLPNKNEVQGRNQKVKELLFLKK